MSLTSWLARSAVLVALLVLGAIVVDEYHTSRWRPLTESEFRGAMQACAARYRGDYWGADTCREQVTLRTLRPFEPMQAPNPPAPPANVAEPAPPRPRTLGDVAREAAKDEGGHRP